MLGLGSTEAGVGVKAGLRIISMADTTFSLCSSPDWLHSLRGQTSLSMTVMLG